MFDTGSSTSSEVPIIQLEETAVVLEAILPHCYPERVDDLKLSSKSFPEAWGVIKALDKYFIWRGIDAFRLALGLECATASRSSGPGCCLGSSLAANSTIGIVENAVAAFAFAEHFGRYPTLSKNAAGCIALSWHRRPTSVTKVISETNSFFAFQSGSLISLMNFLGLREDFIAHAVKSASESLAVMCSAGCRTSETLLRAWTESFTAIRFSAEGAE